MQSARATRSGGLRMSRAAVAFLATAAVGGAILYRFPGIDLWVAGLFYDPAAGFPAAHDPSMRLARRLLNLAGHLVLAGIVVSALWRVFRGRYLFGLTRNGIVFVLLFFAIGPGLIVNDGFKDHWGRARPRQIAALGGDKSFSPPLVIADQCARNCSFVSGEASYGFGFVALAFLVRPRWRRRAFWGALAYGAVIGLGRIAMGGHFLSDVFFAAVFMIPLAWAMHRAIVERGWLDPPLDWLAARLARG